MQENESTVLPEYLTGPAFLVENQIVTQLNSAAEQRQIPLGARIQELISTGSQEYASFHSGKLYLQLYVAGVQYNACVSCYKKAHLFCILSDYTSKELQVLSLTSSSLRAPLQSALDGIEALTKRLSDSADPIVRKNFGQINHSLHQLLRSVGNLSDASFYSQHRLDEFEYLDAKSLFAEIAEKLQATIPTEMCTIHYSGFTKSVFTMLDPRAIERAIYNLVSNAAKFSPKNSIVTFKASSKGNRLYITLENDCDTVYSPVTQLFDNYLRDPALEDSRLGIGLGLSVVRNIVSSHHGTLLVSQKTKKTISFTLSIPITEKSFQILKSPFGIKVDYSGGFDPILVELSDVLPDEIYESI